MSWVTFEKDHLFSGRVRPPSLVIFGTDAVAAARPATAVQLAHAAVTAGYALAVPAAWGDELVASAAIRVVRERAASGSGGTPMILASCPRVSERLAQNGTDLSSLAISLVSPPVATAMYLREVYPGPIHVTFVGGCADGTNESIDEQLSPGEFLARLASQGVNPHEQPEYFESVIPPDRRRHWSLPGGAPTADALSDSEFSLAELERDQFAISLAQRLLSRERIVIDPAPALGCTCAGEGCGLARTGHARKAVEEGEPPRSSSPVIDTGVCVELRRSIGESTSTVADDREKRGVRRPLAAVV